MPNANQELLARAAVCLRSDAVGAIGRRALAEVGIECVVIKGRAFADLLYDRPGERIYRDTDLLISVDDLAGAGCALTGAGFQRPGSDHLDLPPHYAQFWIHQDTGGAIDLHWSLDGPTAPPAHVWRELRDASVAADVGDEPARVLNEAATAFACAVHTARHGPRFPGPLEDLGRAAERLSVETWDDAYALAIRLGAEQPFGFGLGLVPQGRVIAGRLGLSTTGTHEAWLKAQDDPDLWSALLVEKILRSGSPRGVGAEVARWAFPAAEVMRAQYPQARHNRLGLASAYLNRLVKMPPRVGGALLKWVASRRRAARIGPRS